MQQLSGTPSAVREGFPCIPQTRQGCSEAVRIMPFMEGTPTSQVWQRPGSWSPSLAWKSPVPTVKLVSKREGISHRQKAGTYSRHPLLGETEARILE